MLMRPGIASGVRGRRGPYPSATAVQKHIGSWSRAWQLLDEERSEPHYGRKGTLAYDAGRNLVQCHVCGSWRRQLNSEHLRGHGLTALTYKRRFRLNLDLPLTIPHLLEGRRRRDDDDWTVGQIVTALRELEARTRERVSVGLLRREGIASGQVSRRGSYPSVSAVRKHIRSWGRLWELLDGDADHRIHGEVGRLAYDEQRDLIQCHVCGAWRRQLNSEHLRTHDLTAAGYRERFGIPSTVPLTVPGLLGNRRKTRKTLTRDEVLARLRAFRERIGRDVTQQNLSAAPRTEVPSIPTVRRLFGSWAAACEALGQSPPASARPQHQPP
jgi:predicted transcriptional regulator